MRDTTTITISNNTKLALSKYGKFQESYDDIIQKLLRIVSEFNGNHN